MSKSGWMWNDGDSLGLGTSFFLNISLLCYSKLPNVGCTSRVFSVIVSFQKSRVGSHRYLRPPSLVPVAETLRMTEVEKSV